MELVEQLKKLSQKVYLKDDSTELLIWFHHLNLKQKKSLKKDILAVYQNHYNPSDYGMETEASITNICQIKICAMYVYAHNDFYIKFSMVPEAYWKLKYYHIFRPKWILKLIEERSWGIDYALLMEFCQYSDCNITSAMIAEKVSSSFTMARWDNNVALAKKYIDSYPAYLKEHIWYLFTEPTNMSQADEAGDWTHTFIDLVESERLEKMRVLQECLMVASRQFNQPTTGWFFKLFSALSPTLTELKTLEKQLLLTLNSKFSKPQNEALKYLKQLAKKDQLDVSAFVDASQLTLASTVKSVLTNTLAIYEQVAKNLLINATEPKPQLALLCYSICQGFMFKDETIQNRIATFILQYADATDPTLINELYSYGTDLFTPVKALLLSDNFELSGLNPSQNLDSTEKIDAPQSTHTKTQLQNSCNRVQEANKIDYPDSIDDKVFFLNQVFNNHQPHYFDIYLNVIVSLYHELTADNVHRLEPVIQHFNKQDAKITGDAIVAMASHFIHVVSLLLERFTDTTFASNIRQADEYNQGTFASMIAYGGFDFVFARDIEKYRDFNVKSYKSLNHYLNYSMVYFELLARCHHKLLNKTQPVSMLCAPTHTPCLLTLDALTKRLIAHDKHEVTIDALDFQIAISRLDTENYQTILTSQSWLAYSSSQPEISAVFNYFCNPESGIEFAQCQTHDYWLPAVYQKNHGYDFLTFIEQFELPLNHLLANISWQKKPTFNIKYVLKPEAPKNIDKTQLTQKDILLFHEYFVDNTSLVFNYETTNYEKQFCLSPNNAHMTYLAMVCASFSDALPEKFANSLLKLQFELWQKHCTDAGYIYFAMMLLHSKNTVKQLAGELWLKTIQEHNIDVIRLGSFMGKLLHDDFAPMKRFTDLLAQQLMNISLVHNQALITLISNIIQNMNDTPIKGTKKLLELYLELLTVTKTELSNLENTEQIHKKLTIWSETKNLKSVLQKIMVNLKSHT